MEDTSALLRKPFTWSSNNGLVH